jgi:capsular exopolysaccharide synthesis family protein
MFSWLQNGTDNVLLQQKGGLLENGGVKHVEHLNVPNNEQLTNSRWSDRTSYGTLNLFHVLSIARRQKFLLVAGMIAGVIGGATYYTTQNPKYTATTYIYIDSGTDQGKAAESTTVEVDSQVEVIRSWQVADVMRKILNPDDRSALADAFGSRSYFPFLTQWTSWPYFAQWNPESVKPTGNDEVGKEIDLKRILQALSVNRVQKTYLLAVSFTAPSPALAASVANAFVSAYQKGLDDRRLAAEQSRDDWIKRRIEDVRSSLLQADKELQSFRLAPVVGESDAVRRELEVKTQNYRTLYQLLLQQQGTPDPSYLQNGFHVIAPADPLATQRSPRPSLIAALSLVVGLGGGVIAVVLREGTDHTFRTRGQVEGWLGARFLGWLPIIRKKKRRTFKGSGSGSDCLADKLPDILRFSTDNPQSRYAESLREILACASLLTPKNEAKIIGIVAALPGEGKSTLSMNLGRLLAREGTRSLVIDGDARKRGLSRILAPSAPSGLHEVLADDDGRLPLEDRLIADEATGMFFLPIADTRDPFRKSGSQRALKFRAFLTEAKKRFDIIVIDLPPFAAVADARLLSALCDCFVLVTEWARTNKGAVWNFLDSEKEIRERLLGVVLNKVNLNRLSQYEQDDEPQHGPYREYFSDGDWEKRPN